MSKIKVSVIEIILISMIFLNIISPFLFIQNTLTNREDLKGTNLFESNLKSSSNQDQIEGYAIICGISDYPGEDSDLSYCDDDAEDIYDFIKNNYHIPDSNIFKLIDSEVTIPKISQIISNVSALMDENDILFFSYSGHGSQDISIDQYSWNEGVNPTYANNLDLYWNYAHPGADLMRVHFTRIDVEPIHDKVYIGDNNERMYYYDLFTGSYTDVWSGWIPCDDIYVNLYTDGSFTDWGFEIDLVEVGFWEDSYSIITYDGLESGLNGSTINSFLNEVPGQVVTVLDSCNSGGVGRDINQTNRYALTACEMSEFSLEDTYNENGVFSNSFLNSWSNSSDINNDGVVSFEENFEAVYNSTVLRSTYLGYTHHPQEYDGIDGELILEPNGKINSVSQSGDEQLLIEFALSGLGEGKLIIVYYDFEEQNIIRSEIDENILNSADWQQRLFATDLPNHEISGITFKAIQSYQDFSEIDNESVELRNFELSYDNDFDGDSLSDAYEFEIGYNLWDIDWDNDDLTDDIELQIGTDSLYLDTDYDGMTDGWEYNNGLNPLINDTNEDPDFDGVINFEEFEYGTDPLKADTDDDDYSDREEIDKGTNPLNSMSNPFMRGVYITGGIIGFLSLSYVIVRKKFFKPSNTVAKRTIGESSMNFQVYGENSSVGTFNDNNNSAITSDKASSVNFEDFFSPMTQNSKFKFCTNCGAPKLNEKSLFCTTCGHRLV